MSRENRTIIAGAATICVTGDVSRTSPVGTAWSCRMKEAPVLIDATCAARMARDFAHLAVTVHDRRGRRLRSRRILVVDSEHAFDAANDAANCAADDSADRTGHLIALLHTVRNTAGNALGLRGRRNSDCGEDCACDDKFH